MRYANWFVTTVSGASIALLAGESLAQAKAPKEDAEVESGPDAKTRTKPTERAATKDQRKTGAGERRETRRVPVADATANTTTTTNTTFRSSQLIGTNINGADGRVIGKIVDFVSDSRGNIQYPIVSYSGSSGFAGKLFAIPYSGLNFAAGENGTTNAQFSFDPALFKNAPSFTNSQFPNFSDQTYLNELKTYYSDVLDRRIAKDPTVPANGPGDRVQTQQQAGTPTRQIDPTLPANGPGDRPATVNPALPATGTQPETNPTTTLADSRIPGTTGTENAGFPANTTRSPNSVVGATGSPAGSSTPGGTVVGKTGSPAGSAIPGGTVVGSTGSPASSSSFAPNPRAGGNASGSMSANRMMLRSSQMVGMSIQDNKGKSMGKVVDFVGDNFGNNQYAVVSLGADGRNIVLPFNALNMQAGAKGSNFATLKVSPGQLKNAPSFTGNEWPNFADAKFNDQMTQFYSDLVPPGASRGYDYSRFPHFSPDGTKYPAGTAPSEAGTTPGHDNGKAKTPAGTKSPAGAGEPQNPADGPGTTPKTGGPRPRLPLPGSGAPGVPSVPGLPRPGGAGPGVPAPGGAPGIPGGGAPKGGAPGGVPGGGAPGGAGAGGTRGK